MGTNESSEMSKQIRAVGSVTDLLLSILVPTALCAFAGRWMDKQWNLSPWMTLLMMFVSLIVVALIVVKKAKRMSKLIDELK